jgi:cystathionine gamma-lyase
MFYYIHKDGREGMGRSAWAALAKALGTADVMFLPRLLELAWQHGVQDYENARRLAAWLSEQPQMERVYYPGLPGHPGHDLARRQMRDCGGMISIRVRGGGAGARRFLTRTRLFSLAESLGGVESLVCHPATMTHASIPADVRSARGVDDGLVRLSVGIEDADDLLEDLRRALA